MIELALDDDRATTAAIQELDAKIQAEAWRFLGRDADAAVYQPMARAHPAGKYAPLLRATIPPDAVYAVPKPRSRALATLQCTGVWIQYGNADTERQEACVRYGCSWKVVGLQEPPKGNQRSGPRAQKSGNGQPQVRGYSFLDQEDEAQPPHEPPAIVSTDPSALRDPTSADQE
jgi:hypothetical protein